MELYITQNRNCKHVLYIVLIIIRLEKKYISSQKTSINLHILYGYFIKQTSKEDKQSAYLKTYQP